MEQVELVFSLKKKKKLVLGAVYRFDCHNVNVTLQRMMLRNIKIKFYLNIVLLFM